MPHSKDVIIHDKNNQSRTFSFQDIQAVYNELTGNRESMSELIPSCVSLTESHIQQLNYKVKQWLAQYHYSDLKSRVTVRTVDGQKHVFSDISRFLITPNPMDSETLSISIEYNFIIILPNQDNVQNYKLSIQVESNIARRYKMQQDNMVLPSFIIILGNNIAGQIEIEYVDFNVAASLMSIVTGWSKAITTTKNNDTYKKYQKYSSVFPFCFTFLSIIIILLSVFLGAERLIVIDDSVQIFKNIVLAVMGLVIISTSSYILGRIAESSFDRKVLMSYICLNNHDEKLVEQTKIENKKSGRAFAISLITNFFVSIGAGIITALMMGS